VMLRRKQIQIRIQKLILKWMNTKNTNTNTNTNTDPIGDVAKKQNTNTRRSRIWVQILILSCYIMMN